MSDVYEELFRDKQDQLLNVSKKAMQLQARVSGLEGVLKRIVNYQTPDQLRQSASDEYGLDYEEALEMAYENIQEEARAALSQAV